MCSLTLVKHEREYQSYKKKENQAESKWAIINKDHRVQSVHFSDNDMKTLEVGTRSRTFPNPIHRRVYMTVWR